MIQRRPIEISGKEYTVTSDGHIFSGNREMSLYEDRDGYLYIVARNGGKRAKRLVHRLVCEAFLENAQNLPEVNHKNGDKKDNRVENLEWISTSNNQIHSRYVLGNMTGFKDTPVMCVETGERYISTRDAWRKTGINYCHISEVARGLRKTAGGKTWRTVNETLG